MKKSIIDKYINKNVILTDTFNNMYFGILEHLENAPGNNFYQLKTDRTIYFLSSRSIKKIKIILR